MTFPTVGKKLYNSKGPKVPAGDNYGIGVKAKVGKIRGDTVGYIPVSKKKMKSPPREVV